MLRIVSMTALAMLAFAANSVLARQALADGTYDALDYTAIRLISGALMLFLIVHLRGQPWREVKGSWRGAAALATYAVAFSIAYVMIGASAGALILFASVQLGMLAWAIRKGDRPHVLEWIGLAVAFGSLAFLVSPGLSAPSLEGSALMIVAGLAWAVYSLLGRGSVSPLTDTAGNFLRCVPVAAVLLVFGRGEAALAWPGVVLAVASGAVASGLGYAVWYAVLPSLSRSRAAFVQLTVPVIAAVGGSLLLNEVLTGRLLWSSAGILGGVALALFAADLRRKQAS